MAAAGAASVDLVIGWCIFGLLLLVGGAARREGRPRDLRPPARLAPCAPPSPAGPGLRAGRGAVCAPPGLLAGGPRPAPAVGSSAFPAIVHPPC